VRQRGICDILQTTALQGWNCTERCVLRPHLRHLDPSCLKAGAQETATNMQYFPTNSSASVSHTIIGFYHNQTCSVCSCCRLSITRRSARAARNQGPLYPATVCTDSSKEQEGREAPERYKIQIMTETTRHGRTQGEGVRVERCKLPKSKFKNRFCRHNDIKCFILFNLQPKSATNIG